MAFYNNKTAKLKYSDYELVVSINNSVIQNKKGNVLVQNKKGMFYRLIFLFRLL